MYRWSSSYSPDVNAYVIRFTSTPRCTQVSDEIAPRVIVDFDDQSRIVAIEVLQTKPPTNQNTNVTFEVVSTDGEWLRAKIGEGSTSSERVVHDNAKIYKIEADSNGDIAAITIANPAVTLTDK